MYFRNNGLRKTWFINSIESAVSEPPSTVSMLMVAKPLRNPHESNLTYFPSLWGKMICKISPLFKFEILGVFVNTLATEDTYPVRDCENLQFPIQMELS